MKAISLTLITLLFSSFALADLSEKHFKDNCDSENTKSLIGENGSCRILIQSKPTPQKTGVCTGILSTLPCEVLYAVEVEGAAMAFSCGLDKANPVLSHEMEANASLYTVTTVLKTSDGKNMIKQDKKLYEVIEGNVLTLNFEKDLETNTVTPSIVIRLKSGLVNFKNVECK